MKSKGTRVPKFPNGKGKRAPKSQITGRDTIPVPEYEPPKVKPITTGTVVGWIDQNPREIGQCKPNKMESAIHGESARYPGEAPRNKPDFAGSFVGHTVYADRKRKTGQTFLVDTQGERRQMSVRRNETDSQWVWNGRDWVRDDRVNVA